MDLNKLLQSASAKISGLVQSFTQPQATHNPLVSPLPQKQMVQPQTQQGFNIGDFLSKQVDYGLHGKNVFGQQQPFGLANPLAPAPRVNLQQFVHSKAPVENFVLKGAASIPESILNAPSDIQQASGQIYKDFRTGQIKDPMTAISDVGKLALPVATLATLGGGSVAVGVGKTAAKQAAEQSLKQALIHGATSGAGYGAFFGALQGLSQSRDKSAKDAILNTVINAGAGAGLGGALGGSIAGGGNVLGQLINSVKQVRMGQGVPEQQATKDAQLYLRDRAGKFLGLKINQSFEGASGKIVNPKKPAIINDWMSQVDQHLGIDPSQAQAGFIRIGKEPKQVPQIGTLPKGSNPLMQGLLSPQQEVPTVKVQLPSEVPSNGSIPQAQQRGFVKSIQEATNILPKTKANVEGTYVPKTNPELMGEAQALLQEGASIDLKHTAGIDKKIAATMKEAISQQKTNPQLAANLFNNLSEKGTELGRGVQAYSLLNKMSPEAIALSAAGKIKAYNRTAGKKIPELTGDQVALISDKVAALSKLKVGSRAHNIAVNELQKTIDGFIPSSLVDKAITVWKAGLLTSLRTHERNLLGNTIMGGSEIAKDFIASPVDRLMALKTGKRSLTLNMQGTAGGVQQGLQAGKDIIQRGYDPEKTIAKFDQKSITWGNNWLEQALKKGTNSVFRTLGAEDKPFLHGATARSLYDQAKVEAINAGKAGDQKFIAKLISNPTDQMIKTAEKDANYATFHDKNMLSGIANGIKRAATKPVYGKWGEFGKAVTEILAPFTGVPSSIVGKTIDYSPLGLAKGTVNVGRVLTGHVPEMQRQAAQEIGRGVIGTGLFGLGAYLMSKGLMTGQPKDTTEANLWAAQGKQANSVLIGGKWRSINSIGPQNLVLLAGAKYQEEMGQNGNKDLGAYAAGLGKDQLSQTFLAGVQGPLNAITDPARYGQSYIGNQAASIVPNIVKDISKAFDPYQRENNNILDYGRNSIPGLRNMGVEKRDVLGNAMPQEPTGVGAFTDLFNSKTPINNTITNELGRLSSVGNDATPSKLNKSQTIDRQKVKLTPQQLNSFEAGSGKAVQDQLNTLIKSSDYQQLTDEEKAKMIDKVVQNVRKDYKANNSDNLLQGIVGKTSNITSVGKSVITKNGKIIKLTPPTAGTGIDAFTNQNWAVKKALEVYKADIPKEQKQAALKKLGVSGDFEYADKASRSNDIKTQYLISKNLSHDQLLKKIVETRKPSMLGQVYSSDGVINALVDEGKITKAEGTILKKIDYTKDGKLKVNTGTGKKIKVSASLKKAAITLKNSTKKYKVSTSSKTQPIKNVTFNTPYTNSFTSVSVPNFASKVKFNL